MDALTLTMIVGIAAGLVGALIAIVYSSKKKDK